MSIFSYRATTRDGMIVEGSIEAADEKAAVARIKKTGSIPLKVFLVNKGSREKTGGRSSKTDVQTFTSELSVLLGAGLPLDRSLHILSEVSESKKMKNIIQSILKYIREGKSFSDALLMHPEIFSKLYINMIKAGEASGVLDEILDKLNEFLESTRELKEHVYSAMIYPAILIATSVISIIVLLVFVVPRLSLVFVDLGGALPVPTKILISISQGPLSYWWIFVLSLFGGFVIFKNYLRSEEGRYRWDALKLKLMGDIVSKLETARFCRTLGTLLKSGVPLLQALNNSKDVVSNQVISGALSAISKEAKEGKGIAVPLYNANVFAPLALSMVKVGEETGQLENMLIKFASVYEKNLKESNKRFVSILEPVMILGLGLIIGFIVLSMLMAIFSIVDLPL